MSWIAEVHEERAEGRLAECYARIRRALGRVIPFYRVYTPSPRLLSAHLDFDAAVGARGRALEAPGNHDGRQDLALAPEVPHAEPDVVIGAAAEASAEANADPGVRDLLERREPQIAPARDEASSSK